MNELKNKIISNVEIASFGAGFTLLSKIAKEKKYAQEYLGLLARRGDLGSIRIGKRWYTTLDWFSEFEKDAGAKRAQVKIVEERTEIIETIALKKEEKQIDHIRIPAGVPDLAGGEKITADKVFVRNAEPVRVLASRENFPYPQVARKLPTINLRKIERRVLSNQNPQLPAPRHEDMNNWEDERKPDRVKIWNQARGFSPSFLPEESQGLSFFPKFAFGATLVLLFALLFYGGIAHKKDIAKLAGFERGTVAGAESSNVDLANTKNSSIDFLENRADRVRENISISRVIIRAAMEKEK